MIAAIMFGALLFATIIVASHRLSAIAHNVALGVIASL